MKWSFILAFCITLGSLTAGAGHEVQTGNISFRKEITTDTSGKEEWYRTELYFGLSSKGKRISNTRWRKFVDSYITPAFPDGITVTSAYGQWRSREDNKLVKESSRVVTFFYIKDERTDSLITSIISNYKTLFHQESVLRVDSKPDAVRF